MPRHILYSIKTKEKNFDKEEAEGLCKGYLTNTLAAGNCTYNGKKLKCSCLDFLAEDSNAAIPQDIATYIVHWASLHSQSKKELLYQWGRFAAHIEGTTNLRYLLPKNL